jgi:hypothetical protein
MEAQTIQVTWRGARVDLTQDYPPHGNGYRVTFARAYRSVLWGPAEKDGFKANEWIVDALLPGASKPVDLCGATPQEAIDKLDALLAAHESTPATNLVWRGKPYAVVLPTHYGPMPFEGVSLAAPCGECNWHEPRDRWQADVHMPGTREFLDGFGDTPQAALDALQAQLPAPFAAGGSC